MTELDAAAMGEVTGDEATNSNNSSSSSSITTGWIVLLTLVGTIVMLGVVGAFVWRVRAQQQRERLSANLESTPEPQI
jgi:hypothetical protein